MIFAEYIIELESLVWLKMSSYLNMSLPKPAKMFQYALGIGVGVCAVGAIWKWLGYISPKPTRFGRKNQLSPEPTSERDENSNTSGCNISPEATSEPVESDIQKKIVPIHAVVEKEQFKYSSKFRKSDFERALDTADKKREQGYYSSEKMRRRRNFKLEQEEKAKERRQKQRKKDKAARFNQIQDRRHSSSVEE